MKKHIKTLKKKLRSFNPKLKEECGVFGISNAKDASALTALGLHALQHRGQEGCGIVTFNGEQYFSEKRFGLVGDNFNKEKILKKLKRCLLRGSRAPLGSSGTRLWHWARSPGTLMHRASLDHEESADGSNRKWKLK